MKLILTATSSISLTLLDCVLLRYLSQCYSHICVLREYLEKQNNFLKFRSVPTETLLKQKSFKVQIMTVLSSAEKQVIQERMLISFITKQNCPSLIQ